MEKLRVRIEESADQVSRLENAAYYILIATAFLLPIFFIPSTSFQFQFSKAVFVSLAVLVSFALWIVARLKDGRYPLPNNIIFWAAGIVLVLMLVSTLLSPSVRVSLVGQGFETGTWVHTVVMFLTLFLFANLFRPKERVFYLYLALFASSLLIVLFHALRFAFGASFLSFGVFTDITSNLIGKWNDLGIFFGLVTLLSLITLELMQLSRFFKVLLWIIFALSLMSLAIVNFPALWYALAFFSILYFVYAYAFKRSFGDQDDSGRNGGLESGSVTAVTVPQVKRRNVMRGSIAAVALIILSVVFLVDNYTANRSISTRVAEWFKVSSLEVRPNWLSTMEVAGNTLRKDPFFGVGPNRFVNEWLLYKPDGVNQSIFWNTDFSFGIGLLTTQLVTTGALGFVAWVILILSLIYLGMKSILTPVGDRLLRYLSVSSFFASVFLWTFYVFYIPSTVILVLTFLFSGVFIASLYNERLLKSKTISFSEEPRVGFVSVLVLTVLLVGIVTLAYALGQKFVASAYFQRAINAANVTGDIVQAEKYAVRALSVSKNDLYDRLLVELSLVKLNDLLVKTPASIATNQELRSQYQSQFQSLLGDALRYAREATEVNSTNYQNWVSLGRVYESIVPMKIEGAYQSSLQAYERALELNPKSPQVNLVQARLEYVNGNNSRAKEKINTALGLKNNYTEAVFFLSQIQAEEGKLREAIASVESVATLSPNDPTVFFQLGILRYNNRDYRGAIEALERAVLLAPSYSNAKYFLGLSYEKVNRIKDALTQFNDIVTLNPGNAEVPKIIDNIKAGKDPFASIEAPKPESRATLPVEEGEIEGNN